MLILYQENFQIYYHQDTFLSTRWNLNENDQFTDNSWNIHFDWTQFVLTFF